MLDRYLLSKQPQSIGINRAKSEHYNTILFIAHYTPGVLLEVVGT